jgi:hypothetical protein
LTNNVGSLSEAITFARESARGYTINPFYPRLGNLYVDIYDFVDKMVDYLNYISQYYTDTGDTEDILKDILDACEKVKNAINETVVENQCASGDPSKGLSIFLPSNSWELELVNWWQAYSYLDFANNGWYWMLRSYPEYSPLIGVLEKELANAHNQLVNAHNDLANAQKELADAHNQLVNAHNDLANAHNQLEKDINSLRDSPLPLIALIIGIVAIAISIATIVWIRKRAKPKK